MVERCKNVRSGLPVFRWAALTAAMVSLFYCGLAARAAEPLEQLPADVSVLIRLKALDATVEKTVAFANQVMPGTGETVRQSAAAAGVAISNPTLAGVDRKRAWWVAVFLHPDRAPELIFAIPTTDPDALKQALGEKFTVRVDGTWAYYSEEAESLKRLDAAPSQPASTLLDGQLRSTFDDGDLSVLLNLSQVVKVYDAQLRAAERDATEGLDEFERRLEESNGESPGEPRVPENLRRNLPALLGVARRAVATFFQTIRDAQAVVCAVAVDAQGLRVDDLAMFRSGTQAGDFLTALAERPIDATDFDRLPAGKLAYGGWFVGFSELSDWAMGLVSSLAPDEETRKSAEEARSLLKALQTRSYVGAFWLGDLQSGLLRSATIYRTGNASALPDVARKLTRLGTSLGKAFSSGAASQQGPEITIEPEAEQYDGLKADVMRVRHTIDEAADPTGIGRKILNALYGPEGLVVRQLYVDGAVIQVTGGPDDVREVLGSFRATAPPAAEPEFVQMRKLFPRAAFVGLLDAGSFLVRAAKIAVGSGMLPIPLTPEMLQGLNVEPSYLAVGGFVEPRSARLRIFVPTRQLRGWVQIAMFGQQLFQQFRNAAPPSERPQDF